MFPGEISEILETLLAGCFLVGHCKKHNKQKLSELYKSSHRRCTVTKGALKKLAIFTGKHLYLSLFFKLKRDSNIEVFLRIL